MRTMQEPKYDVNEFGLIYNRASSEVIPDDEPVFIFRARDLNAVSALRAYASICCDPSHVAAINGRIEDFKRFARLNPQRMKEPDTESKP